MEMDVENPMILDPSADPCDVWNTKQSKKELQVAYCDWLADAANWQVFLTLTFREMISPEAAFCYFRRLVQLINKDVFGKNYTHKVGHSYFNYVVGMEYQQREVVHFHALFDRPIPFTRVHTWWNQAAGFAYIRKVENLGALEYVTKYVTKSGEENLHVFLGSKGKLPSPLPYWWIETKQVEKNYSNLKEVNSDQNDCV